MKTQDSPYRALATIRRVVALVVYCFFSLSMVGVAHAHDDGRPLALRAVGLDQKLGEQAPLDAEFRDETGKTVRLGDYFGTRPVILTFAYYRCQDLCPLLLDGVLRTLRAMSLTAGEKIFIGHLRFDPPSNPPAPP